MINTATLEGYVREPIFLNEDGKHPKFLFTIDGARGTKPVSCHVCLFGKVAESAQSQNIEDGTRITVTGALDETRWVDQNNNIRFKLRITGDTFSVAR